MLSMKECQHCGAPLDESKIRWFSMEVIETLPGGPPAPYQIDQGSAVCSYCGRSSEFWEQFELEQSRMIDTNKVLAEIMKGKGSV